MMSHPWLASKEEKGDEKVSIETSESDGKKEETE
jgi:hypothetical protein